MKNRLTVELMSDNDNRGSAPRPSFELRARAFDSHLVIVKQKRKPGRPRKDELRKRVRELKKRLSWPQLTRKLNQETGLNLSQSAYRSYYDAAPRKRK